MNTLWLASMVVIGDGRPNLQVGIFSLRDLNNLLLGAGARMTPGKKTRSFNISPSTYLAYALYLIWFPFLFGLPFRLLFDLLLCLLFSSPVWSCFDPCHIIFLLLFHWFTVLFLLLGSALLALALCHPYLYINVCSYAYHFCTLYLLQYTPVYHTTRSS